tara:strand:- start:552 stop:746 length:195 start_codon:yes stop_codon:yes gene_type:complete
MKDIITDKLTDRLVDDVFKIFETQGEQACRNLLEFIGCDKNQIESTLNILNGKYDNLINNKENK